MIAISNVSKSFNGEVVLNDFTLQVNKGDRLCLMGRSGAGKSTVLNLIMQLHKPDSGSVIIEKGLRISCVFQENRLIEALSAEKNITLVTKNKNILKSAQQIGLSAADLQKPVELLSGGQKRRVAILRALLCESDIVVFDEAMQGLDETTQKDVAEFVRQAINNRTLIAVTHSQSEASAYNARVIEID